MSACTFCKKWGKICIPNHPECLRSWDRMPHKPYITSSAPKDKSRILRRVYDRGGFVIRRLGAWLVKPVEHPFWKTKKPKHRNIQKKSKYSSGRH